MAKTAALYYGLDQGHPTCIEKDIHACNACTRFTVPMFEVGNSSELVNCNCPFVTVLCFSALYYAISTCGFLELAATCITLHHVTSITASSLIVSFIYLYIFVALLTFVTFVARSFHDVADMLQTFLQKLFADVLQGEQQMWLGLIGAAVGTFFLGTSMFSALQRCLSRIESLELSPY